MDVVILGAFIGALIVAWRAVAELHRIRLAIEGIEAHTRYAAVVNTTTSRIADQLETLNVTQHERLYLSSTRGQ